MSRSWRHKGAERDDLTGKRRAFCTEGKVFTIGGIICANDESEYAGLCGTVMEIRSGDDCETENDTPDIYCAFDPPTSEDIVLELEGRFSALYGEPKTVDDITLDSVIMAPEMLESSVEPPTEGVDLSGKWRRWLTFCQGAPDAGQCSARFACLSVRPGS